VAFLHGIVSGLGRLAEPRALLSADFEGVSVRFAERKLEEPYITPGNITLSSSRRTGRTPKPVALSPPIATALPESFNAVTDENKLRAAATYRDAMPCEILAAESDPDPADI